MGELMSMVLIFARIRDAHIYLVFTKTTRDFEKKIFKNMNQEMELFWLILRTEKCRKYKNSEIIRFKS